MQLSQASRFNWSFTESVYVLLSLLVLGDDYPAIYKYLNFNQIDEYVENAKNATV
jgi:hypothetical protein